MNSILSLLQSDGAVVLLTMAVGAAFYAISEYSYKFAKSPRLEKIKADYPVFDVALSIASQTLRETKYGLAFDIATEIYKGRGLSPKQVRTYAQALIDNFSLDKYVGTDFSKLNAKEIEQGEAIARAVIPGYNAGTTESYTETTWKQADGRLIGE